MHGLGAVHAHGVPQPSGPRHCCPSGQSFEAEHPFAAGGSGARASALDSGSGAAADDGAAGVMSACSTGGGGAAGVLAQAPDRTRPAVRHAMTNPRFILPL